MSKLSALEKWSYAAGNIPYSIKDAVFSGFIVFYYTQVQGLSGSLAGLAMFLALTWDGILDPVVGSWSDRVRSRWGRRHPPVLVGGILTALMFLLLFPPFTGLSQTTLFAWLLLASVFLRTFMTVYFIPYSALGAELSDDYDERTAIAKARVAVAWIGGMLLNIVAFTVLFDETDGKDGRLVAGNYTDLGVLSMLFAMVTILVCAWGTRSVIPRLPSASLTAGRFGLQTMLTDLKTAARNRNFRFKVGASLAFGMAAGVYTTLSLYLGTYFWEFSSDQLAGLAAPSVVAVILAFGLLGQLGVRYDKPRLLQAAALVMALNTIWMIAARLVGWLPDNHATLIYALMLLTTLIGVFAIVALQTISASFMADILDEQELATGTRQEGVFFAASAFISKATTGLGALLAGVVIDLSGIAPGSAPGEVPTTALNTLGFLTITLVTGLCLVAFFCYRQLRLGRAEHGQIQATLAQR